MKRSRFTEDKIIGILREQEAGASVADLCRKHGMSGVTFYGWKAKYGGMDVSDAGRLKGLESKNAKLKKLLADAMLDDAALKELLAKNGRAHRLPGGLRPLRAVFGVSERRACRIVGFDRTSLRCGSHPPPDEALRQRLRQLAHKRRRFGYRRLHVLLRREGFVVNRKRVYRLYKAERLMVQRAAGASAPWACVRRSQCRRLLASAGRWISCMTKWSTAGVSGSSPWSTTARGNAWRSSPIRRSQASE